VIAAALRGQTVEQPRSEPPCDGERPRRARHSLLLRLLIAYLLPTLALFALFGWLAYRVTERSLEESLGRRLIAIAQAAATQILPEAVLFLSPGDDDSRTAARLRHKLDEIVARTRASRIFVLDASLRSLVDTRRSVHVGDQHYHAEADRSELKRVFAGEEASSVLFVGEGGRRYKTGYAPVLQEGKSVAVVGAEGSVEFYAVLSRLRQYLVASGAIIALLVAAASVLFARRITRPLRLLAREAERIGAGDLERPIAVHPRPPGHDEVGLLAATMNEMRQGLFQRDQHMQMMLSGIAHEVRNPLGGIELFSGLLRDDLAGDTEKLQHVQRIERELHYLKKVVGDFLDYARRVPSTPTTVDLAPLAGEVAELLIKDASDRGVALRAERQGAVWARCDPEQTRRVLINLVRNAIQATPRGGAVTLRCGEQEGATYCEVEDSGAGIAPEILSKIFTPFFTTREKGTGLGLALAKKIVDEHGGTLLVHSTPGQGSTFRVTLPRGDSDGDRPDH
jgi:signal transduction histidine kinase